MSIALVIVLVLLLGAGGTTGGIFSKRRGTVRYIGSAKVKWGGLRRDYDFRVQINGFTRDGKALETYSGEGRYHGGDTWDYARSPDWVFNIAWNKYIEAGGDPALDWTIITEQSFYDYAKKNDKLQSLLSGLQIIFPQLRTTIITKAEEIYGDLLDKIGVPKVDTPTLPAADDKLPVCWVDPTHPGCDEF